MSHPQEAALLAGISALGLDLRPGAPDHLLAYLDLIGRWNKVYNLTAIRDPNEMLGQHLLDCLAVVRPLSAVLDQRPAGAAAPRLLDVGSGAGLPGVVLAICRPDWQVTCVDTVSKKASFIRQAGAELGLRNLTATHQRVEAMTEPPFDLVTSRAFASLLDFISLTRDRLAPQGHWAAMKARLSEEERGAVPADVSLDRVEPLQVPGLDAERCIVWLRPTA
jgi:16S rRNA (guanine527-N7)-methyltransferase